jgi:potassium/chloride transporter 4/5/6
MSNGERKLGTFLGVFTPTILTILGVIMYLRSGWVLGHLGLTQTLLLVALANIITLITTLSFSSMATNIKVGVGGAYYIISRSLGLGIGGAVGLPMFLSQAVSVTLYSFGLAESLRIVWPGIPVQATAFVIVLAVVLLSYRGAELALKTQIPLLIFVAVSLIVLAAGVLTRGYTPEVILPSDGEFPPVTFWIGFAVFFPAVTGIMAGLSLSGDLRKPERSIPLGAILATLTGFAIYLMIPILLARSADPVQLREDSLIWTRVALFGPVLILPGLWGAILSSALGSMLGAPRTLQALAIDHLSVHGLGKYATRERGVRIGLIFTTVIAMGAVLLGDLNAVAPVVTMFFLTVYGTINVVAALETLSGDPSWRPKFRVPWPINLACGVACAWVMFLINPLASGVAIATVFLLWLFFVRREQKANWGDVRRGVYEALFRWALIRLAQRPMSARNWRPHVLVFVDDPIKRLDLIKFGSWFSQERGVVTVCELVVGDLLSDNLDLTERRQAMQNLLDEERITVFAEVDVVRDVVEGITDVAQSNGMAGMASNTVLLGWPKDHDRLAEFLLIVRRLEHLKKAVVIGRIQPQHLFPREKPKRAIHVWWGGMQQNGDLMLLLAYLLSRNPEWRGSEVKLLSVVSNEFAKENTERYLKSLLPEIRIKADYEVFVKPEKISVREVIHRQSAQADVVFLGLATPDAGEELAYAQRLSELAGELPVVFFVKNSCLFVGKLLQPDATAS